MEQKNYLTAEQTIQLSQKINIILSLIERQRLANELALLAGTSNDKASAIKLDETMRDNFIGLMVNELGDMLEDVYCALLNCDGKEELRASLDQLGIK